MRKTLDYTITDEGRDQGKVFVITEMSAAAGEKWGMRVLHALISTGATIPENVASAGMAGVAAMGINALAGLKWEVAEPLLDELLDCVSFVPDPTNPKRITRKLYPDDIEEVITRVELRIESFKLNTSFLKAGVKLLSRMTPATKASDDSNLPTRQQP